MGLQPRLVKSGLSCTSVRLEQQLYSSDTRLPCSFLGEQQEQLYGFRELPVGKAPTKRMFLKVRNVESERPAMWV